MLKKVLIANRGEIAVRIIRTCQALGVRTVAVHSEPDRNALFVDMADEAVALGGTTASESYLRGDAIISAALKSGADGIHPGYGFLSENPDFAQAVTKAGIRFVGPPAGAIRAMGLKDAAKAAMVEAGVPVVPGYHGESRDPAHLLEEAEKIGFPVLIKARAGGGGKGMRKVDRREDFAAALESAAGEALASFGDSACLIEKYVTHPRHIEIQVFADDHGNAVHLFERDCSLQRRHQKVIEEAPAPGMPAAMRAAMGEAAVRAAKAIGYSGAGTVEFIADASDGLRMDRFWFMEMNTRLQVEHPVTEAITGVDLVEWQLRVAAGEPLPRRQEELSIQGWAFEARLYAEDPAKGFLPATGRIVHLDLPEGLARIDSGVRSGDWITPYYDPMIAKIITRGDTREAALRRLGDALDAVEISGTITNAAFLSRLSRHPDFRAGQPDTGLIDRSLQALVAQPAIPPDMTALAALALTGALHPASSADPWAMLKGFRLWSAACEHVTVATPSGPAEVTVTPGPGKGWTVSVDGQPLALSVEPCGEHLVRLGVDGHSRKAGLFRTGKTATIRLGEATAEFSLVDPLEQADESAAGGDRVLAPMPGLIKRVIALSGQAVRTGDALVVMEAMKMELTLSAPRDGIIAEVTVEQGLQVMEGALLVHLEPADAGADHG